VDDVDPARGYARLDHCCLDRVRDRDEGVDAMEVPEANLLRRDRDAARYHEAGFSLAEEREARDGVSAGVVGVDDVGIPLADYRAQLAGRPDVPLAAECETVRGQSGQLGPFDQR